MHKKTKYTASKLGFYPLLLTLVFVFSFDIHAQNVSISSTPNTACNGLPCDWQGPTIMINEIMISPIVGDGSMVGPGPGGGRAEWIELYNPDVCNPVDISCYYLGNYTFEGSGGFRLPSNLIVPPAGFVVLRGVDAAPVPAANLVANGGNTIEIVAPSEINGTGVCVVGNPGNRLWFPNAGGWFAFYDENGVPQDAISWGPSIGTDANFSPCTPNRPGCPGNPVLPSYQNIPASKKTYASPIHASNHEGLSIRRLPDGGAWSGTGNPTYGDCNANCFDPSVSTCTGTATVNSAPGTAPYTYLWNDPDDQTTQTAVGLCEGTYTVTVTAANGVVSTGSVTISNYVPEVDFNMSASLCVNAQPINLTGFSPVPTTNQQGVFSGPGVNQGQFNPALAGVGSHNITYTFTTQSGCTNSAQTTLNVVPLPTLSITAPNQICIDAAPITITSSPAGGVLTGPGVSGNTFNPAIAGVGTHTLTYNFTTPDGCLATNTKQIIVNPLPVLSLSSPNSLCINDAPVTLSGLPQNGTFSYLNNPITQIDPQTFGVGNFVINHFATASTGCSNSTTYTISIHDLPQVSFDIEDDLCLNAPFYTFTNFSTIPAGGTLVFSGPGVQGNGISASNAGIGIHTLFLNYTDLNGCSNLDSADILVQGTPEISMTGNDEEYCVTDTISSFVFTPPGGILTGPFTTADNQFVPLNNPVGFYDLNYVFIDQNNCSDTLEIVVEIVPIPEVEILTEAIICLNDQAAPVPTNPPLVGNIEINGQTSSILDPALLGEGIHNIFFEYTDDAGCYNNTSRLVYIAPIPQIEIDLEPESACPPLNYSFSASSPDALSCFWDFDNGITSNSCDPVITNFFFTDCYSPRFEATNEFGCVNDSVLVNHICIYPVPDASFTVNPNVLTILESNAQFINFSTNATSYFWEIGLGDEVYNTDVENPSFSFPPGEVGSYPVTLTAISTDGCIDSTTIVIAVRPDVTFFAPNTFTPDGDKFNETWRVYAQGIDIYNFHLEIFNRWGELIWESYDIEVGWDGSYGGKIVQDGTYIWQVTAKTLFVDKRQTWRGHINIVK